MAMTLTAIAMTKLSPSPSPSPLPNVLPYTTSTSQSPSSTSPSKLPVKFTPPLIAMVVIIASAFLIITYYRVISRHFLHFRRRFRRWRRRRRRLIRSYVPSEPQSPPYNSDDFHMFSPYGLDDSVIKTIPLSIYTEKSIVRECAVCLLEFEENDYIRTLPVCNHAFHVDCIDIWLRSHANCPLCRTGIVFRPNSPFIPVMAARIRPSLDEVILESAILETLTESQPEYESIACEITQDEYSSPIRNQSEDQFVRRNFLLKRSYSFGFERNLGSERMMTEPMTASPWKYRRGGGFWSKRPSPFSSLTKHRVFSLRGMKSPFIRRKSVYYPVSESGMRFGSSRRSKLSFASPVFVRSSIGSGICATISSSSSSRLRSGDPEALLSPERFNQR